MEAAGLKYCFADELDFYLDMFLQQGYSGMTVRLDEPHPATEILLEPTTVTSVTCTGFAASQGEIERLHGETPEGIKVTVQSGLKNSERRQFYEQRETLVGMKFFVRSCGVLEGTLLFPTFHKKEHSND